MDYLIQNASQKHRNSPKFVASNMSNIWNKIYDNDASFFGEDQSSFATSCYHMMKDRVKTILELGCGQGRDSLFFTSKGIKEEYEEPVTLYLVATKK